MSEDSAEQLPPPVERLPTPVPKALRAFDAQLGEDALADRFRSLWVDQINVLHAAGYNGDAAKRAAYEIWYAQPKSLRQPRTELALAALLNTNDKQLYRWRTANPERFQSGVAAAKQLIVEFLPDVAWATLDNAINGGDKGASDRRLLFEAGGLKPQTGVDVTSGGAPLKAYSVLANPDLWDDDEQPGPGAVGAAAVADPAVAGQK